MSEETHVDKTRASTDETVDGDAELHNDTVRTYLASRERHDGLSPTITNVTVEEGFTTPADSSRYDIDNVNTTRPARVERWYNGRYGYDIDNVNTRRRSNKTTVQSDATIDDIRRTAEALAALDGPDTADKSLFEEALDEFSSNRKTPSRRRFLTRSKLASIVADNESPPSTARVLVENDEERSIDVKRLQWRHNVTAEVSDIGLGQERTLQWMYEDGDEARSVAEALRAAAVGERDTVLEYDDDLSLSIEPPEVSRRSRIERAEDVDWGGLFMLVFMSLPASVFLFGVEVAPLVVLILSLIFANEIFNYTDKPDGYTLDITEGTADPFFAADDVVDVAGEALFKHGGVTTPERVTVTHGKTSDAIRFETADSDDSRAWTIPLDDAGTIEKQEHVAFLDAVGAQELQNDTIVLEAAVTGVDMDDRPCLSGDQYNLYPPK